MGTPEDVAKEKYFTPPDRRTLTDMLKEKVDYDFTIENVEVVKTVFKKWLREVAIGKETPDTKIVRSTLIILVDEP